MYTLPLILVVFSFSISAKADQAVISKDRYGNVLKEESRVKNPANELAMSDAEGMVFLYTFAKALDYSPGNADAKETPKPNENCHFVPIRVVLGETPWKNFQKVCSVKQGDQITERRLGLYKKVEEPKERGDAFMNLKTGEVEFGKAN